ncbi:MAG TPA: hydrogenase subunit MbhD domain-containing protein [Amycolatopsis sp.]|nr:hydrogenase subunit MbhD domain-containing protein [Amycolatopsis sp.]
MTTALLLTVLALVAFAGLAVVVTGDPARQAITLSLFSLTLTVLFLVLQAPDVALSELVVGAAVVPLLVMLTVRKVRGPKP